MRISSSSLVVVGLSVGLWVGLLASSARAEDNPQHAKELYQEGTTFFDLGQFDKAIESWQSGYKEKPDAVFLYNIAQAYRLAGDANKAIFFYKGYLRNAPKAHNRAEVEQKITALQQKLAADAGKPPAPAEPARPSPLAPGPQPPVAAPPSPPPPQPPQPLEPPPGGIEPPPMVTPAPLPGAAAPGPAATLETSPPPVATVAALQKLDAGVAIGADGWGSSVQGKANASFAFDITAGYVLLTTRSRRVQFRLGGAFGYTFLQETTWKDTFISVLAVPRLLVALSPRLTFYGELGIGDLVVAGLQPGSTLLLKPTNPNQNVKVNGAVSILEVRPALGLQLQLTRALGVFAEGAIDDSPKAPNFYAPIVRTELLFGLSFRTAGE